MLVGETVILKSQTKGISEKPPILAANERRAPDYTHNCTKGISFRFSSNQKSNQKDHNPISYSYVTNKSNKNVKNQPHTDLSKDLIRKRAPL
jgi:hypothetical protein